MRNDDAFDQYPNFASLDDNDENTRVDLPRKHLEMFSAFRLSVSKQPECMYRLLFATDFCHVLGSR
jgi:hypothetical protein